MILFRISKKRLWRTKQAHFKTQSSILKNKKVFVSKQRLLGIKMRQLN